jgi:hypothetical protein
MKAGVGLLLALLLSGPPVFAGGISGGGGTGGGGGAVSSVSGTTNQIDCTPTTGAVVCSVAATLLTPGPVQGPVGSVTVPTYAFNGEANSGFYRGAAQDLRLTINGTDRVRLTPSSFTLNAGTNIAWGSAGVASSDTTITRVGAGNVQWGATNTLTIPALASLSGTRYVCVTTAGLFTSSPSACSGT